MAVTLVLMGCAPAGDDAADEPDPFDIERGCTPPPGLGMPEHIADVVQLVNALPMPVTMPCVLEALERPLHMVAARSPLSVQRSEAEDSPRMFIVTPSLTLTVVPIGPGSTLLEMAEYVARGRSIKGELELPVVAPLAASAPYEHAQIAGISTCGTCHAEEHVVGDVDGWPTYASQSMLPDPRNEVPLAFVEHHARSCDPELEPDRCAMLLALFAHGEVLPGTFPEGGLVCVGS